MGLLLGLSPFANPLLSAFPEDPFVRLDEGALTGGVEGPSWEPLENGLGECRADRCDGSVLCSRRIVVLSSPGEDAAPLRCRLEGLVEGRPSLATDSERGDDSLRRLLCALACVDVLVVSFVVAWGMLGEGAEIWESRDEVAGEVDWTSEVDWVGFKLELLSARTKAG